MVIRVRRKGGVYCVQELCKFLWVIPYWETIVACSTRERAQSAAEKFVIDEGAEIIA